MLDGTAYGVVLNDRDERQALNGAFGEPPYGKPPVAPVLYIKPRTCAAPSGAAVALPAGMEVRVAATLALLFTRDTAKAERGRAFDGVGAVRLALDLAQPHASYYRPAVRELSRDGFLPLGATAPFDASLGKATITTLVDGQEAHAWSLSRLARSLEDLIVDISSFMTFAAGDLLLVGLPGDAPHATIGQGVEARCDGLPGVRVQLVEEALA
jgi:5-oxopent-3-ene-1,2,5-tricarboxylate decarboxylase/2-hydroxyhepta-2,4-diene-1,7-dioate isomerase